MKTTYTIKQVTSFLDILQMNVDPNTITAMAEGHTSQVFYFKTSSNESYIFRIRSSRKDLLADQYAYNHFSSTLPVPSFQRLGQFDSSSYYCITKYVKGDMLNTIEDSEFQRYLPIVMQTIATTFQMDISGTSGYGEIDFTTGNAQSATWKTALKNELRALDVSTLRRSAENIRLPDDLVDHLVQQFNDNLPYVSETRRLLHGDPSGDNMLVSAGKVTAVLDWEQMTYGDWMRDFSRFSFWEKSDYGDAREFATEFHLEADNIRERTAVYWAIDALRNIEFADMQKSEKVANWMRLHAKDRLVNE